MYSYNYRRGPVTPPSKKYIAVTILVFIFCLILFCLIPFPWNIPFGIPVLYLPWFWVCCALNSVAYHGYMDRLDNFNFDDYRLSFPSYSKKENEPQKENVRKRRIKML